MIPPDLPMADTLAIAALLGITITSLAHLAWLVFVAERNTRRPGAAHQHQSRSEERTGE